MGASAPKSAVAFADQILDMLAITLVQDSLVLAERFPDNRVHAHLLRNDEFKDMLVAYKECEATGVRRRLYN
jgi:hypothetical protein